MSTDRVDNAEADEDGGGGDGEFFSAGEPMNTQKGDARRRSAEYSSKLAILSVEMNIIFTICL